MRGSLGRHCSDDYGNRLRVLEGQPGDTELRDLLPFLDWLRSVEDVRAVDKQLWRQSNRRLDGEPIGS